MYTYILSILVALSIHFLNQSQDINANCQIVQLKKIVNAEYKLESIKCQSNVNSQLVCK